MAKEKMALITGSSRGLGFEIARILDQRGVRVLLTGRSWSGLEKALQQLTQTKGHTSFCVDLTEEHAVQKIAQEMSAQAIVPNLVIHCLGGKVADDEQPLTAAVLRQSMSLNLEVALRLNEVLIPRMMEEKFGRIIHISSDASLTGQCAPGYAAAKAAINGYVKSTARFYAKHNIMLCAILPGIFEHEGSAWAEKRCTQPEHYQRKLEQMPLGRFAHPEEIASYIANLACDEGIMCTGSLIELNGGY